MRECGQHATRASVASSRPTTAALLSKTPRAHSIRSSPVTGDVRLERLVLPPRLGRRDDVVVGEQHGWRTAACAPPPVEHGAAEPLEFERGVRRGIEAGDGIPECIECRPVGGVGVRARHGGDPQQLAEASERRLVGHVERNVGGWRAVAVEPPIP